MRLQSRPPSRRAVWHVVAAAVLSGLPLHAVSAPITIEAPDPLKALILQHVDLNSPRAQPGEDEEPAATEEASPSVPSEPEGDAAHAGGNAAGAGAPPETAEAKAADAAAVDATETLARVRRARREIPLLLETEGYFSPRVESVTAPDGSVTLNVVPGPRTKVNDVKIEFRGALSEDKPDYAERRDALLKAWSLPAGHPFRQADWASAKDHLLNEVSNRDFAAARLAETGVDVDPIRSVARLKVTVDSGPPFRLGPITYSGLDLYDQELAERYVRLNPGEPYDYDRLVAAQNAVQGTPYFGSAIIEVDRDPEHADAAPVSIRLAEAAPQRFGAGVGYSTNTGARSEVNYRHANLFGQAWELNSTLRLEEKRQSAFADVFFPQTESQFRDAVGVSFLSEDISNLQTQRYSIGGTRTRTLRQTEVRFNLNYQREITQPEGAEETTSTALTLNYGADWRSVDNPSDPRRGMMFGFQIGGGAKALLSDQNFLRLYGHANYYRPLGEKGTLLLRGETGYTIAPSRDNIPQDFLFRTGGSQSVRGYDYQSLGVQDGQATVGGRTLFDASVEYIYWFKSPWGAAVFVDTGDAADEWNAMRLHTGYGVGGRWRSPAGPIGLDVAYGQEDHKVRLHFTISLAL
ncbi:autotransporter assembly complex family protein [Niveibacterium sp. SC-1]|uniref:autotransporter assembly complex protein TamA n=1 Tax=Niveibacterium sp. SC-1 TaxID=3135646 RepID=UPI00311EAAE8